jgi:NTP pyrophosphatase (non-canonical NTP hydrolase)
MTTLRELQLRQALWAQKNFPETVDPEIILLGVMEELGELCHSMLKMKQGIRGTREEHLAKAQDALGDIMIYMMDFCNKMKWDMLSVTEETWIQVEKRDWTKNKTDGVTSDPAFNIINPDHLGTAKAVDIRTPYYAEASQEQKDEWERQRQARMQEGQV